MPYYVQRTEASGSLQIGQLEFEGETYGPLFLLGDAPVELPKKVAKYIAAAYPSCRAVEIEDEQFSAAQTTITEMERDDGAQLPGDPAKVVNEDGSVDEVFPDARSSRRLSEPEKKSAKKG